jgi:hypothetical protein
MDAELIAELTKIMKMTDQEDCKRATIRLIYYMLTIPMPSHEHIPLIAQFLTHSISLLPSSSLPSQLAKKFGIPFVKKKKVSFSSAEVFNIDPNRFSSREAKTQKQRESTTLSIYNTDLFKKFRPKVSFQRGLKFETKEIPLQDLSLCNAYTGVLHSKKKNTVDIPFNLEDIIKNPKVLDIYK